MLLDRKWRVLTIGDGDLSFSLSLHNEHGIERISASIYDSFDELSAKYHNNGLGQLRGANVAIYQNLDVTLPATFPAQLQHQFDVTIFQFPLVPGFTSRNAYEQQPSSDKNSLNRWLIRCFLDNSAKYFLDPNGAGLCLVTSKQVKPYTHWNIENLANPSSNYPFLGQLPFDSQQYPAYNIRNVDRDKVVKDTLATTFVWGKKIPKLFESELITSKKRMSEHCELCGSGPLKTTEQKVQHEHNRLHKKLAMYEQQWQRFLLDKQSNT